jgi:hypothetical protein
MLPVAETTEMGYKMYSSDEFSLANPVVLVILDSQAIELSVPQKLV